MNKNIKEIASILESRIDNKPYDFQQSGLTNKQIEEINNFARSFGKSGIIPFPLKAR